MMVTQVHRCILVCKLTMTEMTYAYIYILYYTYFMP